VIQIKAAMRAFAENVQRKAQVRDSGMNALAAIREPQQFNARDIMEHLNAEAAKLNMWLRTEMNVPA
jgi:hypothetical protein